MTNTVTIILPKVYPPNLALFDGSHICVYGNTTAPNNQAPLWVVGMLYAPSSTIPLSPPSSGTTSAVVTGQTWQIPQLACAANTQYTLAVWASWSSYDLPCRETADIQTGSAGPYTDCTYPHSVPQVQHLASATTFDVLPAAWQVSTQGFAGDEVKAFNGSSTLKLVSTSQQKVVYCNGGDAVNAPRIQLRYESPLAAAWELSFELSKKRASYSHPALQFDGQTRNAFRNVQTLGLDEHVAIPAVISVLPV